MPRAIAAPIQGLRLRRAARSPGSRGADAEPTARNNEAWRFKNPMPKSTREPQSRSVGAWSRRTVTRRNRRPHRHV